MKTSPPLFTGGEVRRSLPANSTARGREIEGNVEQLLDLLRRQQVSRLRNVRQVNAGANQGEATTAGDGLEFGVVEKSSIVDHRFCSLALGPERPPLRFVRDQENARVRRLALLPGKQADRPRQETLNPPHIVDQSWKNVLR